MKETWRVVNTLINKKQKGSEYPTQFKDITNKVTGDENIANGFNKFFSTIGPALARNIPKGNKNFTHYLNKKVEETLFLNPDDEKLALVNNAKSKNSKGHDDIDMCLVKLVIPYIIKPLKHIFNNLLQTGVFPDSMNIAHAIFQTGDT